MHISLAILFTIEGFYPKNEAGVTLSAFDDLKSALPLITFIMSLFSASFGMSKFFLAGPIQFLPSNSAFNGLISIPFVSLCIINSMFGVRIVCMESTFFTSYGQQFWNETFNTYQYDFKKILPILSPEYRLVVYLTPCIIPFLINCLRLSSTFKGSWKYLMMYPQFLISPCFTPFMFEGYETNNPQKQFQLKIWKWGSIVNAVYIGCIPQCILCITDYHKGVYDWEFGRRYDYANDGGVGAESNDALIKYPYGNTIFAAITASCFLILITIFFGSETLFLRRGIHCRCLTILLCPCPNPCIKLNDLDFDHSKSHSNDDEKTEAENNQKDLSKIDPAVNFNQPHTEVYLYSPKYRYVGTRKVLLLRQSSGYNQNYKSKVSTYSLTLDL